MGNNDRLNCDTVDGKPIDIDWGEALGDDSEGWRAFEALDCDECGREVVVSNLGEEEHRYIEPEVVLTITDEDGDEIEDTVDNDCMGTLCFEGPMMNYWYPVKIDDCEEAARAIAAYSLCVVEFEDGQTGLALTGGGMDFSWEICGAFVALGYLPPLHFCDLPDMSGMTWTESNERIVNACRQSAECASRWAEGKISRLENLEQKLKKNAA